VRAMGSAGYRAHPPPASAELLQRPAMKCCAPAPFSPAAIWSISTALQHAPGMATIWQSALEVAHSARTSACSHTAARACKPCLASMPFTAPRAAAQVCGGRRRGGLAERPAVPGRRGACAAAARAPATPGRVRAVPHRARHAVLLPQGARLPATPRAPRAPRQAPGSCVHTWAWVCKCGKDCWAAVRDSGRNAHARMRR